jgi:hypothetical protein
MPSILNPGMARVKLLDTMDTELNEQRAAELRRQLERNRRRRGKARTEVERARDELASLLKAGTAAGLEVKEMSALAGVSRETAHTLLRR